MFRSCITSNPRLARFRTSAQVLTMRPLDETTDWLKLNPLRLNAMVEIPRAVNQIPTTGHTARKKCSDRELLNDAYWKIRYLQETRNTSNRPQTHLEPSATHESRDRNTYRVQSEHARV